MLIRQPALINMQQAGAWQRPIPSMTATNLDGDNHDGHNNVNVKN